MSSTLVNIEFSERIKKAFQLLPAYAYLTGAQISKVQSFAETLLDSSNVSEEDSPGFFWHATLIDSSGTAVDVDTCVDPDK